MNVVPVIHGTVDEGGRFRPENADRFRTALRSFAGKEVDLTVQPRRDPRSMNQNRYYWGVVVRILGGEFGYQPDEMHEILKSKFLRRWSQGKLGVFPYAQSTAKLSTIAFEDYLEQVRTWAASEFNVNIPLPGEVNLDIE